MLNVNLIFWVWLVRAVCVITVAHSAKDLQYLLIFVGRSNRVDSGTIQAQAAGCSDSDVHMVTVVDLNVPGAKSSERLQEIASCIQFVNDLAPQRHCALVELPEIPKKSSKRGLADEEKELQECLWSLRQGCDIRWICPFEVHASAEVQSGRRTESCLVFYFEDCVNNRQKILTRLPLNSPLSLYIIYNILHINYYTVKLFF